MAEEVFDVVMQATDTFQTDVYEWQKEPPPEEDFELGPSVWVGSLPNGIGSDLVFDACSSAGYKFYPHRQYGCRYAICRGVQPDWAKYYEWDSDGWIRRALFVSRLIRPTTIGTNLSAKLYFRDGELQRIVPGPTQVVGAHAFVVADTNWRNWLSVPEFEELRTSMPRYLAVVAPERVRQARRHIDHAFHTWYLDQRCASLVTGFESLLKVSPYQSTKQFALRAPRLAERVGLQITEAEATALYDDRSAFVHGTQVSFTDLNDELIAHYNQFEQVLRRSLFRASTDSAFSDLFSSDRSIEEAFGK